jgi:hypothetical protein
MMTVRPAAAVAAADDHAAMAGMAHAAPSMVMDRGHVPWPPVPVMTVLSFVVLAAGVVLALLLRRA